MANGNAVENATVLLNPPGRVRHIEYKQEQSERGLAGQHRSRSGQCNIGTGSGTGTFTIAGTSSGRYVGSITAVTGTTANLVKNGTGSQSIIGPTSFSGVTLNDGTLEVSPDSIGTGLINIAKGDLAVHSKRARAFHL